METNSVSRPGVSRLVELGHASHRKVSMKKLFSFLFLISPTILFADSSVIGTKNTFSFSQNISTLAAATPAWQVFNGPENRKTIYIERVVAGSDGTGRWTFYSTTTGVGFTGTQVRSTATPMDIGKGTSVSSCTYSTSGSAPTGDIIWQGVFLASTTYDILNFNSPIAVRPGKAIYAIKNNSTDGKSYLDFYFREEYAP